MKKQALIFLSICFFSHLGAESNMPGQDYKLQVGLDNESKVEGTAVKTRIEELPMEIQIPEKQVDKIVPPPTVDLTNAYLLKQIDARRTNWGQPPATNLIALPDGYSKELAAHKKMLAQAGSTKGATTQKTKVERLLFMQCRTAQDYKINTDTTIKMFCRDAKNNSKGLLYRMNASLAVEKNSLLSTPYLLENEDGEVYSVNKEKSRLFNAANGSKNLATFVDKRALDKAEQGAAGAFATEAPALAKDYIAQSNKADSELVQTTNGLTSTVAQSTVNPKPDAGDYGISLLISMLGNGMKAGVDQLYLDLGFIYYIPRDTIIEAEIVIEVEK